ncbi:hypothetical protein [Xenorhabdus innexi]|uniref:Uncharacterized protein n=1 Tax=Xenorhabdus innexi TaxID=290109 RepID=A0A1N6MQQ1_9GAMM|nr:hypothetical protein [Xenorhabdus innexi]PHM35601.1 hypothetical protein Xinn_02289 [Xenorhabdus innexi]SIP71172.1 hypothetical protein XIS1_1080018 [Xenorhabdus innexi]
MFNDNDLPAPIIEGYNGSKLYNHGKTEFCVEIPHYEYAHSGDQICFYVNEIPIGDCFNLDKVEDLGTPCIYKLPFSIFFPINVSCSFSYTVQAQGQNEPRYSATLIVTYTGKSEGSLFKAPTIYSSFGYDNDQNIIEPHPPVCGGENGRNVIDCHAISNYKEHNNQAGLYLVVKGGNHTVDGVPFGNNVEAFACIESSCHTLANPYSLGTQMMLPDANNPSHGSLVYHLSHRALLGFKSHGECVSDNGFRFAYGKANFWYEVNGKYFKSDVWKGRIFTCGTDPKYGINTNTVCTNPNYRPCYNCPE